MIRDAAVEIFEHQTVAGAREGVLEAAVDCWDEVRVAVREAFEIRRGRQNRDEARPIAFTLQAWIAGRSARDLVRYDSAYGLADLHRHYFDEAGNETRIAPVSVDALPWVDEFVREAVGLARRGA